ncbi:hypothetical protein CCR75_003599 [Bremia lactucae]|uniref:Uncharacterized protein n=1 Tax=Bremia lactucae TaxID=4779 RepID=A0A976FEP7_BRELC|nr:hypothetical protein CCR75_003599 [Bremia lactucae]
MAPSPVENVAQCVPRKQLSSSKSRSSMRVLFKQHKDSSPICEGHVCNPHDPNIATLSPPSAVCPSAILVSVLYLEQPSITAYFDSSSGCLSIPELLIVDCVRVGISEAAAQ